MHTFQVAVFVSDGLRIFKGEYEVLDDMASKVEAGSANLYFIPHFAGRTCPSVPSVKVHLWVLTGSMEMHTCTGRSWKALHTSTAFTMTF